MLIESQGNATIGPRCDQLQVQVDHDLRMDAISIHLMVYLNVTVPMRA